MQTKKTKSHKIRKPLYGRQYALILVCAIIILLPILVIPLQTKMTHVNIEIPEPPSKPTSLKLSEIDFNIPITHQNKLFAWSIQIETFHNRQQAKLTQDNVTHFKLPSYIAHNADSNAETFTLFAGPFATQNEAESIKQKLDEALNTKTTITHFYALEDKNT